MFSKYFSIFFILVIATLFISCQKYLDKKQDSSLVVPASLQDLQALLDDNRRININQNSGIGEASADNYYLTDADYSALVSQKDRSIYSWESEIFYDNFPNDWSNIYAVVNRANIVLDKLKQIELTQGNQALWNNVRGSALFIRAEAFFVLARNFSKAYDSVSASVDLGIPLRLEPDFNLSSTRSSIAQTYSQILGDLYNAASLLPAVPVHVLRPSKPAAYALLARVYLSMRNYSRAGLFADSCLRLFNTLIDYNTLNPTASLPFSQFNSETIYYANGAITHIAVGRGKIDSLLYQSFSSNDLRKQLFFVSNGNGTYSFKGHYSGIASTMFVGIASDEIYLIKAECLARQGNIAEAMNTLNILLLKRWKTGTFIPFASSNSSEALSIILTERRKELLMRDLRWMDIKRLNKEGSAIMLKRILNGQQIGLEPNDLRFALPLPAYILALTGMPQNPR